MHLTDQAETRAGDQPDAMAGVPPVEARVSTWLLAARKAVAGMFRRQAAIDKSAAQAWRETLEQVIADLDLLNRNTEQDFLTIGGKLADFIE